jgi:hypothetical protein
MMEQMDEPTGCDAGAVPSLVSQAMLEAGRDCLVVTDPRPGKIRRPAPFAATRWRLLAASGQEATAPRRLHARP